jgi:hypothetical protein
MYDPYLAYSPFRLQEAQLEEQQRQFDVRTGLYKQAFERNKETGTGLTSLIDTYNKSFAEAKAANEAKYQQALGLVDQTTGQQRADVLSQFQGQRANTMQQLARTGLGNTTVGSTLQQGLQREQTGALNRVSDQMLGTKLGVMQGFEYKYPDTDVVSTGIKALTDLATSYPSF